MFKFRKNSSAMDKVVNKRKQEERDLIKIMIEKDKRRKLKENFPDKVFCSICKYNEWIDIESMFDSSKVYFSNVCTAKENIIVNYNTGKTYNPRIEGSTSNVNGECKYYEEREI